MGTVTLPSQRHACAIAVFPTAMSFPMSRPTMQVYACNTAMAIHPPSAGVSAPPESCQTARA
jgi:hypothetical protein